MITATWARDPVLEPAWIHEGAHINAMGADAYMTKPFSTKELAEKVRELLGT